MKVRNCIAELHQVASFVVENLAVLNAKQINIGRDITTWTIAQNMEHLKLFNESFIVSLSRISQNTYSTPWYSHIKMYANYCGNKMLKTVNRSNPHKTITPLHWRPTISDLDVTIFDEYLNSINQIIKILEPLQNLNSELILVRCESDNTVYFTLDKAAEIIVEHQWRHIQQSKEMLNRPVNNYYEKRSVI